VKKAYIVTGLGYGDEGKGTIVDFLTQDKKADLIVKFNGGSQAAHNVHTPEGKRFTFSQFGSGSFHGANTYLSKFVSIDPLAMLSEGRALSELIETSAFEKMFINEKCKVITPYHREFNRQLEKFRKNCNHGSCGIGYGISIEMSLEKEAPILYFNNLLYRNVTLDKLRKIYEYLKVKASSLGFNFQYKGLDIYSIESAFTLLYMQVQTIKEETSNKFLTSYDTIIFEGAQGALLDEWKGFNPYTTWSTTTNKNAKEIIKQYSKYKNTKVDTHSIGVTRSFSTRHGTGPFVAKEKKYNKYISDDDNCYNEWQSNFEAGYLDLVMLRYALSFSDVNSVAITHYDKIQDNFEYVEQYWHKKHGQINNIEGPSKDLKASMDLTGILLDCKMQINKHNSSILDLFNEELNTQVSMLSFGKTYKHKSLLIEI